MPAKNTGGQLLPPWKEFLAELGGMLSGLRELHCNGGFELVHFYGFPVPRLISTISQLCPQN